MNGVRFTSAQPIELRASGWGTGRLHLHAWVDGVEHMPAAADIRALDGNTYVWTLSNIQPSMTRLRLYLAWSDAAHRPLPASATDTITLRMH